jgi:hypothetical protein
MPRMGFVLSLLVSVLPADAEAARHDYAKRPDHYARYLAVGHLPAEKREDLVAAMQFAVPSASRETALDRQIPEHVPGSNVYRIQLEDLGWDWKQWNKVLEKYPYAYNDPYAPQMAIRADWLVAALADTTESDAYYRLLYGAKPPANRDEFLAVWGVDQKQQSGLELGWIETQSQVSKQGTRFIRRFLSNRGSVWSTQDVLKLNRTSDPLEFPDGAFKHDGEESIAMTPKVSARMRTRGASMAFLLSNGAGKRVEEAPVDLVEDYQRTIRSQSAIINNGSCIGCHIHGLHKPSTNGVESLLLRGVQLYAKDKGKQAFVERFHLGTKGLETELERANEDFAAFVEACNGLTPEENAVAYRQSIRDYESDLRLERAAEELGCTAADLRNALAYAAYHKLDIGPRFSALAHGDSVPRATFEQEYQPAEIMLKNWRASK